MLVKNNYKKHWREFVSTTESSTNQVVTLLKHLTQDKELINAYAKHNLNKIFGTHTLRGWHPIETGVSLAQMNPILFYTTIKDKAPNIEQMKWSRKIVGLPVDKISSEEISKKQMFFFDFEIPESDLRKFQTGISWDGVEGSFKTNVIKSMRELYISYAYKKIPWILLEISSGYRNAERQSNAMIDYAHDKRKGLSKEYAHKDSMILIEHLNANGDLLTHDPIQFNKDLGLPLINENLAIGYIEPVGFIKEQNLILISAYKKNPENYKPSSLAKDQWNLYEKVTVTGEKKAFDIYFSTLTRPRMYKNSGAMKEFLYLWFEQTGYIFPHMRHTALDFSKNNKDQREEFGKILKQYSITAGEPYEKTGNFHVSK